MLVKEAHEEVVGRAGYSECDFNGHLNNCRYVDWFFNLMPERVTSLIRPMRLDINFKTEIMRGSEILASTKEVGERRIDFCAALKLFKLHVNKKVIFAVLCVYRL